MNERSQFQHTDRSQFLCRGPKFLSADFELFTIVFSSPVIVVYFAKISNVTQLPKLFQSQFGVQLQVRLFFLLHGRKVTQVSLDTGAME